MTLSAWTFIGLFAAAAALRFAMRGTKVDAEHLFAALSAYLLAGLYFGLLYWALEQIYPGTVTASNFSRTGAICYSFVTLATIGYGDIFPRTDVARGWQSSKVSEDSCFCCLGGAPIELVFGATARLSALPPWTS